MTRLASVIRSGLIFGVVAILCALLMAPRARSQSVALSLCPVGNPGNAPDATVSGTSYGAVAYTYDIGKFDVTLTQYAAFLNAVASKSDPYKLYNSGVAYSNTSFSVLSEQPGIIQTGGVGSYVYAVVGNGLEPVTFVNWFAAARFCNWLHNGEPATIGEAAASTETGAYTLAGDTTSGLETRNPDARWWIPAENEWYKAAYYDPTLKSGSGGYYQYATEGTTTSPPGNTIATGTNQANYFSGLYFRTQQLTYNALADYLTPVGDFKNSPSHYGTFDQSGDVFNWNDALTASSSSVARGLRGGCWFNSVNVLSSTGRSTSPAGTASNSIGFRVATSYAPSNGVFEGLIDNSGIMRVFVNAAKQFAGYLLYSNAVYPIHGNFISHPFSGVFGRNKIQLGLNLTQVNSGEYELTGSVTGTSGTAESFSAYHSTYGFARLVAERGTYSLTLSVTGAASIVATTSSATLAVTNTGAIGIVGTLPDGHHLRIVNIMVVGGIGNQILIHQPLLYPAITTRGERGLLNGNLEFKDAPSGTQVSGTLEWIKPEQSTGTYPAAFDGGLVVTGTLR
jgi:formylglycine-generating enzyme